MSIQIFLDNYNNVYIPGQTISGRIECTFNNQKKLRAITVQFYGGSKTSWSVEEDHYDVFSKQTESRRVTYSAEEVYFDTEYNLVQGGESFNLPPGKHVYPFSYILPPQLPSSFEGGMGSICYYIKAVVDRPWKFDYKTKVSLNVISPIDLNFIPGLRDPVAISDEKNVCSCWCNDAGALTFNISVLITGYVPGQEINIGSYVQNLTNISAEKVQFKVVAKYEYIAHSPSTKTRYIFDEIVKCVEGGIGAHGEKSWTSTILIPLDQTYPNLIPCSIINIHYILMAKVVLPWPHSNLELDFPITIGSVALSGVNTTIPGPPLSDNENALPNHNTPLINHDLPGYKTPTNFNTSYLEKYSGRVLPPYPTGGGEGGICGSAPPPGVMSSYLPITRGSAPYPSPTRGLPLYLPPSGGSAPYPPSAGESTPYFPLAGGSSPYSPPTGVSRLYSLEEVGWSELNPKDTIASAPPPSYEESRLQEK